MDWKSISRLLRGRRPATVSAAASDDSSDDPALHKLKLRSLKAHFSQPLDLKPNPKCDPTADDDDAGGAAALESLVADLFAGVSAVKASYAQLQLAQSPYDPDSIQLADQSVVAELKRISELKQAYIKRQISPSRPLAAQIHEQKSLIKTFQISIKKLETELQAKDSELTYLRSKLGEIDAKNRALESRLHPHTSLAPLANLHLSALNPNHLLICLRYAVKSVRSFAKAMSKEMDAAGWDPTAAAAAITGLDLPPEHRRFALESFVSGRMFAGFHRRDLDLDPLTARSRRDRNRFFEEFSEFRFASPKSMHDRSGEFGEFCRAKYLSAVHPKMEAAFFSGSGREVSGSEFDNGFAELAKRVWLLHCLFFSFEVTGSVFQAGRGSRFSEAYMESVADLDPASTSPTVGFTVVPGFRVGSTVIQCKVYLC